MNLPELPDSDGNRVRSVKRALDLLELLMISGNPLSLSDISERVNLHPSTAHRILATMEQRKFVSQDQTNKMYTIGPKLLFPARGLRLYQSLRELALPLLSEVARGTGEGASFTILYGTKGMVIAKATSTRFVEVSLQSGMLVPLHCTALGKAILAYLDPAETARILEEEGMPPSTPKTITDPDRLFRELGRVRQVGYAIDREEWEIGIRCVAAPVFSDESTVIGAISVSCPSGRLPDDEIPMFARPILEGASQLSVKLG